MSFSINITAAKSEIQARLAAEHAPDGITAFIVQAIEPLDEDEQVRITASGHIDASGDGASNAEVHVHPLPAEHVAEPKETA